MRYLPLVFLMLPSVFGGGLVIMSHYGIRVPDILICPFGTDGLFYAEGGTLIFHLVVIGIIYFPIGIIMYFMYQIILGSWK